MLSMLFVAAVILMTLFANIYYNHQYLECLPAIGLHYLIFIHVIGFTYSVSYISQTYI